MGPNVELETENGDIRGNKYLFREVKLIQTSKKTHCKQDKSFSYFLCIFFKLPRLIRRKQNSQQIEDL